MVDLSDYKQFAVEIDEFGTFKARLISTTGTNKRELSDVVADAKTLVELRKKLDKLSKANLGQDVYVFLSNWKFKGFKHGRVTSMTTDKTFRVVFDDETREIVTAKQLIKETVFNKEHIDLIEILWSQAKDLERQAKEAQDQLSTYNLQELLGDVAEK